MFDCRFYNISWVLKGFLDSYSLRREYVRYRCDIGGYGVIWSYGESILYVILDFFFKVIVCLKGRG